MTLNFATDNFKVYHFKVTTRFFYQMDDMTVWVVEIYHSKKTHKSSEPVEVDWPDYYPKFETVHARQASILWQNHPSLEEFPNLWKSIKHMF